MSIFYLLGQIYIEMKLMKNLTSLTVSILAIALFSCVNKLPDSKVECEQIDIDIKNAQEFVYSDLVDTSSLEFIILETSENCLLGQVMKFHKHNDKLVFLADNKIVVFNVGGKFLYSVDKHGKGPGEYGYLMDVFIDKNDFIYGLDMLGKIVKYDTLGNHIKTFNTGLCGKAFTKLENNIWAIYTGSSINEVSSSRLNFYSEKQEKIILEKQNISTNESRWMHTFDVNNFSKSQSCNFYNYSCNDTLYKLDNDDLKPFVYIDFGKYRIPTSLIKQPYKDMSEFCETVNRNNLINSFLTIFNTDKHLYFSFRQKDKFYQAIYNWSTKEIKIIDKVKDIYMAQGIERDVDFNFVPRTSDSDYLYNKIDPLYVEELIRDKDNVPECLKDIKANDNPVIVRYKLNN